MPLIGPGPGNRATRLDPPAVDRVKRWTRAVVGVDDEVGVMVKQLRCTEPGCRPRAGRAEFETVIAVLHEAGTLSRTVYRPVTDVTETDVRTAFLSTETTHDH